MESCWVRLNSTGLRTAWAPGLARGIRPVDTQKSTVAAPSPTRLGPRSVPWAFSPWQLEQLLTNNGRPTLESAAGTGSVDPVLEGLAVGVVDGLVAPPATVVGTLGVGTLGVG